MTPTQLFKLIEDAAASNGTGLAIIDQNNVRIDWSAMLVSAQEATHRLRAAGVRPGDRVVLVLENCVEAVAFFFAATALDAIAVAVNARMTGAELQRIVEHSDPAAMIFTSSISQDALAHAQDAGAWAISGSFGRVHIAARSGSMDEPVPSSPADRIALMLYTSGTTGAPKAAMLSHGNLLAAAKGSSDMRGMVDGDMTYLALPLSHIFGLVTLLAVCFAKGSMRLEARFDVARLYNALQEDVTLLPAVPQMHAHLFEYARAHGMPNYDKGLLRFVSSGGAPLDPAWKREAEDFYGIALQNGYGLTECAAGVCATHNEPGDPDISVGTPMGDSKLTLDMQAEGAMPNEGIGEIVVEGAQVMKGYFRDPEQTARVLTPEGALRTGDLGRFDERGNLHIVGRTKELIIRSGFNVYPVEIEATLTEHPKVIIAAVVGRVVAGNEEVLAFVKTTAQDGASADQLHAFLRDRLAPYKRPSYIVIAQDLPAAPTGKILKSKLIEHFADQLAELTHST